MSYIKWLLSQNKKNNPIGDLARDLESDIRLGAVVKTRSDLKNRMSRACDGAIRAEEDAHNAYSILKIYKYMTREYR